MVTARERFVASVVAPEVLRQVVTAVRPLGIPVMPLKGVLLQQLVFDDPTERFLTDVDVLIPLHRWPDARGALLASGFEPRAAAKSMIEESFHTPGGFVLDLHGRLFGVGRYRMRTRDVFERAAVDRDLFGVPIHLMDGYDLFAHLVGKIASDHLSTEHADRYEELSRVPARLQLSARRAADRLVSCGLRRAARYALAVQSDRTGDAFARSVLNILPRDPVGDLLVAGASTIIAHAPQRSIESALAGHLLNHSLPRAGVAMGAAAVNRVRYWARSAR